MTKKERAEMIYRLGELFCGPGGIAWGALNADIGDDNYKIIHQWANDYDKDTGITSAATIQKAYTTKTFVNLIWKTCQKSTPWLSASRAMITALLVSRKAWTAFSAPCIPTV